MIILIHGEDTVSSRRVLQEKLKEEENSEVKRLEPSMVSLSEIITFLTSQSLFSQSKILILENLLSKYKLGDKDNILKTLNNLAGTSKIILWEEGVVSKNIISKSLPKAKVFTCTSPSQVFKFLDSIGVKSKNDIFLLYRSALKEREVNFLQTMLIRQMRYLIIAKQLGKSGLTDLTPWQANKFFQQARFFSLDDLMIFYRQLVKSEYDYKSGLTPYSFSELIDILLLTLLR